MTEVYSTSQLGLKSEIFMKSKTETFNHINDFAIYNDQLWYKSKKEIEWKQLFFDGALTGVKPVEIQADGANLVVLDDKGEFHYKKVLNEFHKHGEYTYEDISSENNWNDRWFSFPIIERIYHIFEKKRLQIPQGSIGWALSHRGKYNHHFEDVAGKKHPEFAMVTGIYAIHVNRKDVVVADPYLIGGFKLTIIGPDPNFVIELISASASTIFLSGKLNEKTKRYVKLADFDTIGKNPFLLAFWSKKNRSNPVWTELPDLPDNGDLKISIYQNGEGNHARIIQVKQKDCIFTMSFANMQWK